MSSSISSFMSTLFPASGGGQKQQVHAQQVHGKDGSSTHKETAVPPTFVNVVSTEDTASSGTVASEQDFATTNNTPVATSFIEEKIVLPLGNMYNDVNVIANKLYSTSNSLDGMREAIDQAHASSNEQASRTNFQYLALANKQEDLQELVQTNNKVSNASYETLKTSISATRTLSELSLSSQKRIDEAMERFDESTENQAAKLRSSFSSVHTHLDKQDNALAELLEIARSSKSLLKEQQLRNKKKDSEGAATKFASFLKK